MNARDVMVSPVITVRPSTCVKEVAQIFLQHKISAAPVVDDKGKIVGLISEGDLIHRAETGTERHRAWWLQALSDDSLLASDYIRSHSSSVADVMTRHVITASPDTPLDKIAMMLEKNGIKRVPIICNDQLVGIVSRANLVQALATGKTHLDATVSDSAIRDRLLAELGHQTWAHTGLLNVTVNAGVVDLWGFSLSDTERKAIQVAAEGIPGVRAVNNELRTNSAAAWA